MSEGFAALFEASYKLKDMRRGSIISATVVDVVNGSVIVDAGLKSEGFIPAQQFYNERGEIEVNVGDQVDVALDMLEDGYGETRLSREKAKRMQAWSELESAHEDGETVRGVIVTRVKGGFTVDIRGLRAFLPGSLVDARPLRDTSHLEGECLDFKIIKIDRKRNNVVISRRAAMDIEDTAERNESLLHLQEGVRVEGVVKNLTEYGAFLDIGGIDGLLHVTDMAWRRVKNPAEVVSIGEKIEVKVLKFDRERNRVSLGLKQTTDDPWVGLEDRYPMHTRLSGRVTNLVEYGCFVELEEGVEGLVHSSEMDWTNRNANPPKFVQIGEQAEVVVLEIDQKRRRISLGMKQCRPNPWEEFAAKHSKGERVTGKLKSITDFGMFIELEGGIDGLVHLSDVSRDESESILRQYQKGQQIESVVLAVDAERERISLGLKQLEKEPFSSYVAEHAKGSIVKATVTEVQARHAVVGLADGVEGQLKSSELARDENVEDARTRIKAGDELEVKITAVDRKKRTINVSVKARIMEEEQDAARDYTPDAAGSATTKLGDILKEQMDKP